MATSKEVIELLFNSEYNDAGTRALKRDLNTLSSDFGSGVSAVSGFTVALGAMELAAIAASIGLAKAGVDAAGRFGDGFNEISTLITDVDADLVGFKASIQEYASGSTASLENINGAIYNAISAGVDYKDSIAFLSEAEKLSVAGKTDLNSAVKVLTGTLSAYGAETSEAGKYSDILFSTVKNGVTTVPELVASLGQVTGTAASLGVSFSEVSAATATMTKNNIATSQSMTVLKAIIAGIIKPTKEAQETADQLGIGLGVTALQSKGLAGVIEDMAIKTGGSKEQMAKLFGSTEALNGALILTSENGLKTFKADLDAVTNSTGATSGAFEKMKDNAALIEQTLANNIELTLGAIGEPLLDDFKDIDKAITEIFNQIRQQLGDGGALSGVIDSVESVAATVARIINNMAQNTGEALKTADLSGFSGAFDQINQALTGLDLASPEGLAEAISAIGKAFEGLTKYTLSAGEVIQGMLELFAEIGGYLKDLDGEFIGTAGAIGGWAIVIGTATAVLSPFIGLLLSLKKAGGLAGVFGSGTAVAALSTAVKGLGVAGGLAAASWAGFKIGEQFVEGVDHITGFAEAVAGTTEPTQELTEAIRAYGESIGKPNISMEEYIRLHQEANQVNAKNENGLNSMGDAISSVTLKTKLSAEEQAKWNEFVENGYSWTGKATDAIEKNSSGLKALTQSAKPAADEIKKLGDSSKTTKNALESLDAIKPVFDFQTAKVEAQAQEITSIMDALGVSASSTGDALSSAFNVLGGANLNDLDFAERWAIEDSIKDLSKAQVDIAAAEKAVADAKAEFIRAQTSAAQNGDPLITIDSNGLEPELEAFMFKILERIQIKVAANEADFLLGMGGA